MKEGRSTLPRAERAVVAGTLSDRAMGKSRRGWPLTGVGRNAECIPARESVGDTVKGFTDESVILLVKYPL